MPGSQPKQYVVTGASGFIGNRLVRHLASKGHRVVATIAHHDCDVPEGVEKRRADVTDPASLAAAFAGADGVFHLAALFNAQEKSRDEYRAVNVEGTKNVLRVAHEQGVRRVVHCSTVGVATEATAPPYDEDAPYAPIKGDKYEETKAEGEQAARQLAAELGQSLVVIRPTQVYGPGDKSKIKFYRLVRKGMIVNPGATVKHPVYVDDVCRGMALAMCTPEADQEVILVAGRRPVPLAEMVATASRLLGVREPRKLPAWPAHAACVAVEKLFPLLGKRPPVHSRSMDFFRRSLMIESDKAKRLLGYEPSVRLEDGMREAVAWYREQQLL